MWMATALVEGVFPPSKVVGEQRASYPCRPGKPKEVASRTVAKIAAG
jgi:hypothetical protein